MNYIHAPDSGLCTARATEGERERERTSLRALWCIFDVFMRLIFAITIANVWCFAVASQSIFLRSVLHQLHHHRHRDLRRRRVFTVQQTYNTITPIRWTNSKTNTIAGTMWASAKRDNRQKGKTWKSIQFSAQHIVHEWYVCRQQRFSTNAYALPFISFAAGRTNTLTQSTNKKSIHHHHLNVSYGRVSLTHSHTTISMHHTLGSRQSHREDRAMLLCAMCAIALLLCSHSHAWTHTLMQQRSC